MLVTHGCHIHLMSLCLRNAKNRKTKRYTPCTPDAIMPLNFVKKRPVLALIACIVDDLLKKWKNHIKGGKT